MPAERALLVTIQLDSRYAPDGALWPLEDEQRELRELAASTGARIVGEVTARRHQPVAGTMLGTGKLDEIAEQVQQSQAQVVIFNVEFSSAQQRNVEEVLRVKTIDRTQLILDIFAQRARSQEGKVQVELAQLRYLMPRLVGKGIMLSRLGGGIGTRGPGEQRLEADRRRIRQRITRLSRDLDQLARRREATRSRRKETEIPVAALIGYTNAGKTTLLNCLTGAGASARNQLFTTLDPLARRMRVASGEWVVLTDTVGFLHHLPHQLIEAFKATLEEARDATVLLHVLDASHPLAREHAEAVATVLKSLDLERKPMITILNKSDLVTEAGRLDALERLHAPAVAVSAKTGQGLDDLRAVIVRHLEGLLAEPIRLRVPAERGDVVTALYDAGQVLRRDEADGAVEFTVRIPGKLQALFEPFRI